MSTPDRDAAVPPLSYPKQFDRFTEEMQRVDEMIVVLLKGHLLIEEALSQILDKYLFHPVHAVHARLSFAQKLHIVRALALRKHDFPMWAVIASINSLRNDVAHRLTSADREKKLGQVRAAYAQATGESGKHKEADDKTLVLHACALAFGFLTAFESDSDAYRKVVHGLDRQLNPDLPAFDL